MQNGLDITYMAYDYMSHLVGILAYGSLISDPGEEIKNASIKILDEVGTPFRVEFARSSKSRGGAPTLVPVERDGAQVRAKILVLNIAEDEAMNRLWRRETGNVGSDKVYRSPVTPNENSVIVKRLENFEGVGVVLYTAIAPTIKPLTAGQLAKLAIESVAKAKKDRDGISYLIDTKYYGIETPLSIEYEAEILYQSGTTSLSNALEHYRRVQR